jgi:hypothetical protein
MPKMGMTGEIRNRPQQPRAIADMIGKVLDPACAKRGLSSAALIAAWPQIVGRRYADCTQPERIIWPRRRGDEDVGGGTLVLRVDGGQAIYLQHELGQVIERINSYLGFNAVTRVKIVQTPLGRPCPAETAKEPALAPDQAAALDRRLDAIDSPSLRESLRRLGQAVLGEEAAGSGEQSP